MKEDKIDVLLKLLGMAQYQLYCNQADIEQLKKQNFNLFEELAHIKNSLTATLKKIE